MVGLVALIDSVPVRVQSISIVSCSGTQEYIRSFSPAEATLSFPVVFIPCCIRPPPPVDTGHGQVRCGILSSESPRISFEILYVYPALQWHMAECFMRIYP